MRTKLLLITLAGLFLISNIQAQINRKVPGKNELMNTYKNRITSEPKIAEFTIDDKRGTPGFIRFKENESFSIQQSDEILNRFLPVRKEFDRLTMVSENNAYGQITVQRYQQYFNGIKVEHGSYAVTAKDNKISFMSGEFYMIDAAQEIIPAITEDAAFEKALAFIHASVYSWQTADSVLTDGKKPVAELVFVDDPAQLKGQRLAFKFNIYALRPVSRSYIYVDAANGEIIFSDAIIKHVNPGFADASAGLLLNKNTDLQISTASITEDSKSFSNSTASADTRYTGTRSITTDQVSAGQYRLRESDRTAGANNMGSSVQTFNSKTAATYVTAVDFTDADNNWTTAEYNNAAKDNAALDAHWGAEKVIDYWWNIHGRRSIDNKGFDIKNYVHYDVSYDNAYWNGTAMTYGDGSGTAGGGFNVLTALDVCGHEIGHGLCEFTANLVYSYESGAMNEGFSDIWGACIENYAISIGDVPGGDNKEPFKIGEEIVASAAQPLRSMINPNSTSTYGRQPDTYLGTYWATGAGDNGGVHTNSGVLNHWFYVLVQGESGTNDNGNVYNVTGIGWTKAEKIAYVTELNLSSTANYADCRTAAINAVIALYGRCSAEHIAVTNAWYAVGVGAVYGSCTVSSTVQFAVNTDKAAEASGKADCTYPSGTLKSHTINATITLSNVSSATAITDATITLAGTATSGVDYTISPSVVTWAANTSGSKDIVITIFDDNNSEPDETIILGYTLNAHGGTAVAGSINQNETITISDDDTAASTYMYDRLLGDLSTYATTTSNVSPFRGSTSRKRIQYFYGANEMQIAGIKPGNISHLFLYIVGKTPTVTFTNLNIVLGTTAAANLNSAFAAFTNSSTVYSGNYAMPTTENFYDFPLSVPLYWDGVSNIVLQICYDGASGTTNYLTAVSVTGSTNISTRYVTATTGGSLCGTTGGTTATTRPDIYLGMYNPVQTAVNLSRTAYLGPNTDASFFSASDGKLMARIVNNSSFDYGCTQILVDRAGTSASTFWRNNNGDNVTDKTFRVLPTNDNPSGIYDITLYYTKVEHDGWETATGKDWETLGKIVKIKGHDIKDVTPATVSYFSDVTIASTATRAVFGNDYSIRATFGTGFSGFAVGDPGLTPLPIKLISFTGLKNKGTAVLNWVTGYEYNNDYFEIETSADGSAYHKIGVVAGKGNSGNEQSYKFTDMLPANGTNYYRLKQVDINGQFTYSNIVQLDFDFDQYLRLNPNPAHDVVTMEIGKPASEIVVRIYAFDGKLVHTEIVRTLSRTYPLNISKLAPGTYVCEAILDGQKLKQNFIKQ